MRFAIVESGGKQYRVVEGRAIEVDITQKIIDNNLKTAKTITDVQTGLKTGDVNKIKGHAGELQNVTKALTAILPK